MTDPRKPAFAGVIAVARAAGKPNPFDDPGNVHAYHNLMDAWDLPREPAKRVVGPRGIALMHKWEGCRLAAYPDPGSANGEPWTIGRGATGPGIAKGVVWTQAQADARFERDLAKYADQVSEAIGDAPTTQAQFDALVSFHYNTGAIRSATLTKLHKAGKFAQAQAEFSKWVKNDGKVMPGLVNRRRAEAELYGDRS